MTDLRALLGNDAWFVDDWFDKTGAVDLSCEWKQTGKTLSLTLRQTAPFKRVRVPVEIRLQGRRPVTKTVFVDGAVTTVTMPVTGHVGDAVLDPHYRVLRWTPQFHAEADAIVLYVKGDIALNYGKTADARAAFEAALPSATGELQALLERGLGDADFSDNKHADAAAHYLKALALAPDHWQTPEVWRALADVYRALGDEAKARAANDDGARAITRLISR
jgi:predicted Zn-dependent protease